MPKKTMPISREYKKTFKLGLIINPLAGLGGPSGLKGSDHRDTATIAEERGVISMVDDRVISMLSILKERLEELNQSLEIVTASGVMGETACESFKSTFNVLSVYDTPDKTHSSDTLNAAKLIKAQQVDLLVFAGGDGTARDIYQAIGADQAVLGLPAGVKMHSGVFAVTPKAVASVIESLMSNCLVSARMAEVRDIDEIAFAQGRVSTQYFGEMLIPDDQLLVQCVKCSGMIEDELMLDELCAFIMEELDDETLYILGSGGTLKALKSAMGIEMPTLLGVDVWYQGEVLAQDVHEAQLYELVQQYKKARIMLSIIGGQGIVLGRGNQQISPRIIEQVGLDNLEFLATQSKILALEGKPLRIDSGSDELDKKLSGFHKIMCAYDDALLYEIRYLE
jgi:predicted polyphosphate/ATP-dependent NAD kinase